MEADHKRPMKLGRFSIIGQLGRGLHGVVFLADDPQLQRRVAIKILHPEPGVLTPTMSPHAKNLARLRHPNIISLYDVGVAGNRIYLVCEYLEGNDLRNELRTRGALLLPEAVSIGRQIVDGMAFAHARGILHMDLTPSNVMLDQEGHPRIMDFDLSRSAGVEWHGELTGTLRYVTPEHTTTRKLDKRTDVYALGLIIYELITGRPAVSSDNPQKMVSQIREGYIDWEPLRQRDPAGQVTAVLQMAMQRDPAARYQDAGGMLNALRKAVRDPGYSGGEQDAPVHGTVEFMLRRIKRKGDFPAISSTLIEINRLTAADSNASARRLANVILRDYAITNRLLKLANSAYFSGFSGQVKSVTDAIRVLGMEQVRGACNGLTCFSHFASAKPRQELQDALISSFVAGLMARFLATNCDIGDVEEAFLCGMLHNLGRTLVMYYFTEDYADIEALIAQGADSEGAAHSVLGIRHAELGYAIACEWKFPEIILYSMADEDMKVAVPPEAPQAEVVRSLAAFANTLCAQAMFGTREDVLPRLRASLEEVRHIIALQPRQVATMLAAALEKFERLAPVLEVNPTTSRFMQQAGAWLATVMADEQRVEGENPAGCGRLSGPAGTGGPGVQRFAFSEDESFADTPGRRLGATHVAP